MEERSGSEIGGFRYLSPLRLFSVLSLPTLDSMCQTQTEVLVMALYG